MTRYAIGDIHGGSMTFRALLKKINLQRDDQVYLLGDYVDRGPDSKGVLDMILQLMVSGYDVRPVRGNHDDMMLQSFIRSREGLPSSWLEEYGVDTLGSFGVNSFKELPREYVMLLETMPHILMDDDYVFVHAGLDLEKDDPLTQTDPSDMLWSNVILVDSSKIGGRKLITGHNIRPMLLIEESLLSNRIYLDNGAFTNQQPDLGNLVALNLDTMTLIFQPWIDGEALW